jgi:hypothetical protein
LTKEEPTKKWSPSDIMEFEDEDDQDFVINSLILKTAVLGPKAVENERNIVAVKTKGYQEKDIEQPIFSLTLGRNEMVTGMDITLANDHNQEVEFKLIEGTGPVYITCNHIMELPIEGEQQTIMTTSDGEVEENEEEDIEDEDDEEDEEEEEEKMKNGKGKKPADIKKANAKNGKIANGKNGEHASNGKGEEIEMGEK